MQDPDPDFILYHFQEDDEKLPNITNEGEGEDGEGEGGLQYYHQQEDEAEEISNEDEKESPLEELESLSSLLPDVDSNRETWMTDGNLVNILKDLNAVEASVNDLFITKVGSKVKRLIEYEGQVGILAEGLCKKWKKMSDEYFQKQRQEEKESESNEDVEPEGKALQSQSDTSVDDEAQAQAGKRQEEKESESNEDVEPEGKALQSQSDTSVDDENLPLQAGKRKQMSSSSSSSSSPLKEPFKRKNIPISDSDSDTAGETFKKIKGSREAKIVMDEKQRPHVAFSRTGPGVVILASSQLSKSTCEAHCNDLKSIHKIFEERRRPILFILSDDGGELSCTYCLAHHSRLTMSFQDVYLDVSESNNA